MSTAQSPQPQDDTAVLHAARRVFARVGPDDATLEEIAAEAQMSADALRARYGSKEAIAYRLLGEWIAQDTDGQATEARTASPLTLVPPRPAPPAAPALPVVPAPAPAPAPVMGRRTVTENRTLAADLSQLALLSVPPTASGEGGVPLRESFASAMRSLAANKQRAVLTMLGIIIGVSSVIAQLSVGNGLIGYVRGDFEKGTSSVVVVQGTDQQVNGLATGKRRPSLTVDDALALAAPGAIPDVVAVDANVKGEGQVVYNAANASVNVVGVLPAYPIMLDYKVTQGEFFGESDVAGEKPVAVLGSSTARKLFGTANPIGEYVFLNGKAVQVIGVMEEKGAGGLDNQVYLPLSTALNRVLGGKATTANNQKAVDTISVKVSGIDAVLPVEVQVQQLLDDRHRTEAYGVRDFETSTSLAIVTQVLRIIGAISAVLIIVACISLLVGGVGLTNIMLVSVTERTREIGIRKAIGAKQSDILWQFLVESVVISLVGAAIGVAIGGLLVVLVNVLWRPAPVSVPGVLGAVLAALVTGVIFGVSPARKAARMKPIEALRTE